MVYDSPLKTLKQTCRSWHSERITRGFPGLVLGRVLASNVLFLYCESRAKQGDAKPVKNVSFSMKRVESTEHIKPVRFVRQKHLHLTNSAAVILGVGLDCTGGDPDLCCQEHGNVQLCHAKLRNLSGLAWSLCRTHMKIDSKMKNVPSYFLKKKQRSTRFMPRAPAHSSWWSRRNTTLTALAPQQKINNYQAMRNNVKRQNIIFKMYYAINVTMRIKANVIHYSFMCDVQ